MPATIGQRINRTLLAIAEDPAASIDQKLTALAQLTQLHKGKTPQKRKPRKLKQSAGSLLGD